MSTMKSEKKNDNFTFCSIRYYRMSLPDDPPCTFKTGFTIIVSWLESTAGENLWKIGMFKYLHFEKLSKIFICNNIATGSKTTHRDVKKLLDQLLINGELERLTTSTSSFENVPGSANTIFSILDTWREQGMHNICSAWKVYSLPAGTLQIIWINRVYAIFIMQHSVVIYYVPSGCTSTEVL